jgi:hypothetical protein
MRGRWTWSASTPIAVGLIQGTPGISLPRKAAASLAPTDMSAVVPVQYLADMVVLISDAATGEPALAVIIEPQLRDSETKRFSWPVYVTTARRLAGCPAAVLVVICPDPASEPGARTVLDAMSDPGISEAERLSMTAIIMSLASDAAWQFLEAMMHTSEYKKTFLDEIHEAALAEGEVKGEARGEAKSVLKILDARGLASSQEQRQRVMSCTDAAQLDIWLDRAITADTTDELFPD